MVAGPFAISLCLQDRTSGKRPVRAASSIKRTCMAGSKFYLNSTGWVGLFCTWLLLAIVPVGSRPAVLAFKEHGIQDPAAVAHKHPENWPATAPTSMAELQRVGFPDPALCCDVETKGTAPGKYPAPDGGQVSVYQKPGNYSYQLQNGIKVWSAPGSLITLEYGKHKVLSYRKTQGRLSNWNRRAIWNFPDGSQLIRYYNPAYRRFIYGHRSNQQAVDFLEFADILPGQKTGDGFAFYYKPGYAHVVDLYLKSERRQTYNEWIARSFPQPSGQKIPFLIFENVKEYNDFLQEKSQARPGGRGFAGMVLLCCGADYGAAPADAAAERSF